MKNSILQHYRVGTTTVRVKSHGSSKTLRLKIDPIRKIPILTVPVNCNPSSIRKFLNQCQSWLQEQMVAFQEIGQEKKVLFKGEIYHVSVDLRGNVNPVVGIDEASKMIYLDCSLDRVSYQLKRLFRKEALEYSKDQSQKWAKDLNVSLQDVLVKDYRARWGSCSSRGILTYSWRLIQAPPQIFDYVCAHEVAHLLHLNHSPAFWQVVSSICPHYQESRRWLKINGLQLFNYL